MDEALTRDALQHARYVNRLPRESREKLHEMINNNVDINTFNSAAMLGVGIQQKMPYIKKNIFKFILNSLIWFDSMLDIDQIVSLSDKY